jgi:hypothetical protein
MTKNKIAITDGSDDGVGVTPRQLAQHAGKDEVGKEIFNIDIWCMIFEKVSA